MTDGEIDAVLKQAAQAPHDVDPALLSRVAASLRPSLRPVRPLPPVWALVAGLVLICTGVALAGAARSGLYGIHKLSGLDRALIFPALGILILLSAAGSVAEMIPGSRRRVSPEALLLAGTLTLLAVFGILFHDYRTERFVAQGIVCLAAGLFHALPVAIAGWWLLRRGFAVNPVAAGWAVGTLSGLAGLTMLELHCANLEVFHVVVWHIAVLLLSGVAGASLAQLRHRRT